MTDCPKCEQITATAADALTNLANEGKLETVPPPSIAKDDTMTFTMRLYPELIVLGPPCGIPAPPPCETCGGDGFYEIDTVDGRNLHTTRAIPCPDCQLDEGDDAPPEDVDTDAGPYEYDELGAGDA